VGDDAGEEVERVEQLYGAGLSVLVLRR